MKQVDPENVPLLSRDPDTRGYQYNFTRFMPETFSVAQLMMYEDLPVPKNLQLKLQREEMMHRNYNYAAKDAKRYERIRY